VYESLILREKEIDAEFTAIRASELSSFFKWSGLGPEDFKSPTWGLNCRGWGVSYVASFGGGFRTQQQRDPFASCMFYMKRFVLQWEGRQGPDAGTDQRIDDMRMNLENAGGDARGLLEAEALAASNWRPL
jgi:hypothetical protein